MLYSVYCHTFPNGKKYIGISKDPKRRWSANGLYYMKQTKIARAINKYGWQNVKHDILVDGLTEEQAKTLEVSLIAQMDTIKKGYNVSVGGDCIKSTYLSSRVMEMIRAIKKFYGLCGVAEYAYNSRYEKQVADLFNNADFAVESKHGRLSPADELSVAFYWVFINNYIKLNDLICEYGENSKEVLCWKEKHPVEYMAEEFNLVDNQN